LLALVNDEIRAIPGVKDVEVITYLKLVKQWQPEFVRLKRGAPSGQMVEPTVSAKADETKGSQRRVSGPT
jgi:hypothetical protein